jgi:type I restriction enzyme R subunit
MTNLTENTIEQSFIDQLVSQGYTYYNGVDISPMISKVPRLITF